MSKLHRRRKWSALLLAVATSLNLTALGPLAASAEPSQTVNVLKDEKVSSGVHFTVQDINNYNGTGTRVGINRLDINPADGYTKILSSKALETVNAVETIGDQAAREILQGNNVVAGINADMFDMTTGMPLGLMVREGELITSQGPDENDSSSSRTSFYMDNANKPGIDTVRAQGSVTVAESVYDVNLFNRNQSVNNALVIDTSDLTRTHKLTHFYGGVAGTASYALIRIGNFNGVHPGETYTGTVEKIYTEDGFTIPEDAVVLAGYGTMKKIVDAINVNDPVSFSYNLIAGSSERNDIMTSLAFNRWLVRDGHPLTASEMGSTTDAFVVGPNARTALGIKEDGSLVVVTVDKPSASYNDSIGTNLPDLAQYLKDAGCVNALNLDGGGSTEMIVREPGSNHPVTVNHPSDGSSRIVTNSLLFVSTATKSGTVGNVVVDKNVTLYQGSQYDFSFRVTDEFGNPLNQSTSKAEWSTAFGTIDENGHYTANAGAGKGTIKAMVDGVEGSAEVTVVDTVNTLNFTSTNVVMQPKETKQFGFTATDASGSQVVVDPATAVWNLGTTADGKSIGTVSASGLVTATADSGTATLTATVGNQTVSTLISVGLKEQVIDDFETYPLEGYHLSGTGYNSVTQYAGSPYFSLSTDIKHSGSRSFQLNYDLSLWTKKQNGTLNMIPHWYTGTKWPDELAAQMDKTYKTDVYPKKFGVWVYGDGKAPWLRAIFKDGTDASKTIDLTTETQDINWVGWKYVEVDIPQGWQLPIRLNYIYMAETDKLKPAYSGSVYFDDMKFLYTDEATDFSGPAFSETMPASEQVFTDHLDFSTVITDSQSGVDASKITVKVNDQDQPYQYDADTGRLGFKLSQLAEGNYHVVVDAYDHAGNESVPWIDKTYHVDLTPDTEPPVLTEVTPNSDVKVKIPTPRVTFKLLDSKSQVDPESISVKMNAIRLPVYYDASTGWGYAEPASGLADGSYTLTINAKDKAENAMPTYRDQITLEAIPQPADSSNFGISIIPDTQGNAFTDKLFKRANSDEDTSLIMHMGDIVDDGSQQQYDDAANYVNDLITKPFFVLAGNHEAFKNSLDLFYQKFGSPTLHFDYGDTLIIMLNSAYIQSITESDSTQFHWLEEVLASNTKRNVLVFDHVITRDAFGTAHEMNHEDAAKYESILSGYKAKHPDYEIYSIFGHLHTLQTWDVDGVKYIISGNGADKFYVGHGDGDLLGSGKLTVADGKMNYTFDPLLTKTYIRNDAIISDKMKAVIGSNVQLDLYGDFREYPSQYITQLNNHDLVGISWKSSSEDVASVDQKGVLTAKSSGTVTITGTSGGKSSSITVTTVNPSDVKPVKLEMSVNPATVVTGNRFIPTLKATDAYGSVYALSLKDVVFSFKNGKVSQNEDGSLQANAVGEEEITAVFKDLKATASITIVPKQTPPPAPGDSDGNTGNNDGNTGGSTGSGNGSPNTPVNTGATEKEVKIDLSKDSTVASGLFADFAKVTGGTMTLTGPNYSWTLRSEEVNNTDGSDRFDLGVKLVMLAAAGEVATPVQVNTDNALLGIALNQHGALPGKMTLHVEAGKDQVGQKLFFYAINSSEEAPVLLNELTADDSGQVAIPFTSASAAEYLLTTQKMIDFLDADTHWAKNDIYYLANKNIINGVNDTQFMPNQEITRGEFVKMIAGIAGADVSAYTQSIFTDVKSTDWYAPYLAWASQNKIVLGMDNHTFAPNAKISREQMAVILVRLTNLLGYTPDTSTTPVPFKDEQHISSYAADAVRQARQAGLINGLPNNEFAPAKGATRGEAAKMLAALFKQI